MPTFRCRQVVFLLFLAAAPGSTSQGSIVTWEFAGTITEANFGIPTIAWFADVGDTFSGHFTFDTSQARIRDGGVFPRYSVDVPPGEFVLTVNAVRLSARGLAFTERFFPSTRQLSLEALAPVFPNNLSPGVNGFTLFLNDDDKAAQFGFDDSGGGMSGLSDFELTELAVSGDNRRRLLGSLSQLEQAKMPPSSDPAVIPEPSALATWLTLAMIGSACYRPRKATWKR